MNIKKATFLFLALLLPACVFMFLKFFGKNEFDVPPLYSESYPEGVSECAVSIALPYHIPDSLKSTLGVADDGLTLIYFGELNEEAQKQFSRVKKETGSEIKIKLLSASDMNTRVMKCVFFLKKPYNMVLIDEKGFIRGQYVSDDRDEIDRLLTEVAILLKKF
jgi:hypothetical protein